MEDEIKKTILGLANFFDEQSQRENAELIKKLHETFEKNEALYECQMTIAFLNFTRFAAMPWLNKNPQVTDGWDKSLIECIYNGTFPHFVRKVIEKNEGSCCSGDKESFIIKKVKESIVTGTNISLYADYTGCETIDKDKWNQQAYWSPKSFKDTDEVIKKFWDWYNVIS